MSMGIQVSLPDTVNFVLGHLFPLNIYSIDKYIFV